MTLGSTVIEGYPIISQEEINENMPLEVNPKPDTIIRINMEWKAFNKPIEIEEQKLAAERQNLNKNCERFKRLMTGLTNNFNKIPNE